MAMALLSLSLGATVRIKVSSQEEFDALSAIGQRLAEEDDIQVELQEGIYYYRENHLDFSGLDCPDARFSLQGNGSLLIPVGKTFAFSREGQDALEYDRSYSTEDGFVSLPDGRSIDFRDAAKACRTLPIPVDLKRRVFRFRCDEPDLDPSQAKDTYILLTQWYIGAVYRVQKIRNGWLYFYAEKKYRTRLYEEFRYGRCRQRYVLYNQKSADHPYLVDGKLFSPDRKSIHRCEATAFLNASDGCIGSLRLTGCRFVGNRSGGNLLQFVHLESGSIEIDHCCFEGIRSHVVLVSDAAHFRFHDNVLTGCYRRGIHCDYLSRDCHIYRNRFLNHGQMLSSAPAVYCQGSGFVVSDNYFENFAYCAIGLGTHYVETDGCFTEGIVERNEICQTDAFRRPPMATLIDSGAIYVWTQNKRTVIRQNYIHDISGAHGNRGILCDDGVVNVSIYDNFIVGIDHNSYCIDLRKRYAVERKPSSFIHKVNVGNRMWGNWVDGRVRFHIRKGDRNSFAHPNYRISAGKQPEALKAWKKRFGLKMN